MNKNTSVDEFQASCAELWNVMAEYTTVDTFYEKIKAHEKSVFLGYADLTIGVGPLFAWKVRGVGVKLLNGKAHLEMPTELGADGTYYPITFPKTKTTREVATLIVFQHAGVNQAMQNAAKAATPAEVTTPEQGAEIGAHYAAGVAIPKLPSVANPFEA